MGSKTVPCEKYSLILKHEYIDNDGKAHLLNEPLVVNEIISLFETNAMVYSANTMIHELLDRMEYEAMHEYGE